MCCSSEKQLFLSQTPHSLAHVSVCEMQLIISSSEHVTHIKIPNELKDVRANCLCASLLRTQFMSQCHIKRVR